MFALSNKKQPKYLRVQVEPKNGRSDHVNIRIPLQLIRAGARLTSLMPGHTMDKVQGHLNEKGINIDLDQIKKGDFPDGIIESLREMAIEVDDDDEYIRICCE